MGLSCVALPTWGRWGRCCPCLPLPSLRRVCCCVSPLRCLARARNWELGPFSYPELLQSFGPARPTARPACGNHSFGLFMCLMFSPATLCGWSCPFLLGTVSYKHFCPRHLSVCVSPHRTQNRSQGHFKTWSQLSSAALLTVSG